MDYCMKINMFETRVTRNVYISALAFCVDWLFNVVLLIEIMNAAY
jgi:hypothetical protein